MKYDFETLLDRRGTGAIAIDSLGEISGFAPEKPEDGYDAIPMWVADMNFLACPTIPKRIIERTNHPLYGYFSPSDEYYEKIIAWQNRRNGVVNLNKENIGYENGVLGGLISALKVLCSNGDNILINSPTYIGFTNSINNNGYHLVHSELVKDENDVYHMNFSDMENLVKKYHIHVFIMCSPHNPVGRVWKMDELKELSDFCERNSLYVISDEIWSDIILDDNKHIPTQSVSDYLREHTFSLYAPSKTFNLAGLIGAYHLCYNKVLHERILKESSLCHYNDMNLLSMEGLLGAYEEEGYEWADELKKVLSDNVKKMYDYLSGINGVKISRPEGTYMLFADFEEYLKEQDMTLDELLKAGWNKGVMWQDGRPFHGKYSIRINVALPSKRLDEAINRLNEYVFR